MCRLALLIPLACLLLAPSASARVRPPCQPISGSASSRSFAYGSERCAGTTTVHASVNGHQLLTVDLSNYGNTATFYGQGSVVKLNQRSGRVYVIAVTTERLATIVVWFTR